MYHPDHLWREAMTRLQKRRGDVALLHYQPQTAWWRRLLYYGGRRLRAWGTALETYGRPAAAEDYEVCSR